MTDTQVQERVVDDNGQSYRGVTNTVQTSSDPFTGASTRRSSTRMWSGQSPWLGIIGLVTAVVLVLLAADFIFHAAGAANVGFAAFIFSIGSALAAPFAGIFKTAYASPGNIVVWADVLAIAVYAVAAALVAKVATMILDSNAKRAAA
jgi:hypothetical protein